MQITTWNANGKFREKFQDIARLESDIYIIQECEDPNHAKGEYKKWATNAAWIGKVKHKGLGIFARASIKLQRLEWIDNDIQSFLPVRINNQFNLIGVWTKHSKEHRYIGQAWKYLQLHAERMAVGPVVFCGDFNSNKIWDKPHRNWNHSDVVRELASINIISLYHVKTGEEQGEESADTLYLQKNVEKPYHIDYAFCSRDLIDAKGILLNIGSHKDWLSLSDHMPVTFNIDSPPR